jgi:hypothetical protein
LRYVITRYDGIRVKGCCKSWMRLTLGAQMRAMVETVQRAIWACLFAWHEMKYGEPRRSAGQAVVETALVIAVIVVVAIPATQLLREAFASAYILHSEALALPSVPPTATPVQ